MVLLLACCRQLGASGDGGAFADPEPSSVEDSSSRGPCFVDDGQGLSARFHPVTTAADGLQTSTPGATMSSNFGVFLGAALSNIERT